MHLHEVEVVIDEWFGIYPLFFFLQKVIEDIERLLDGRMVEVEYQVEPVDDRGGYFFNVISCGHDSIPGGILSVYSILRDSIPADLHNIADNIDAFHELKIVKAYYTPVILVQEFDTMIFFTGVAFQGGTGRVHAQVEGPPIFFQRVHEGGLTTAGFSIEENMNPFPILSIPLISNEAEEGSLDVVVPGDTGKEHIQHLGKKVLCFDDVFELLL